VSLEDEIFAKVAGYVLGNALISLIAGAATFVWLPVFGVPYPLLLAILVALLDLIRCSGRRSPGSGCPWWR
jgi:predicted PurR-regulated permease PerM